MKNIQHSMKKHLKSVYKHCRNSKNRLLAYYWGSVLKKGDIEKHARHEAKREKQYLVRPIDLKNPKYFIEKLYWLKYNIYNKSKLVAQCYNKYEVRKYVESKGLGYILNELYGVWDSVDDVPWDDLPEECVLKTTNGYGGHVFKKKGIPFSIDEAKEKLTDRINIYKNYYKISGDLFAEKTPNRIICERILHSNYGYSFPEDYKIHCYNGVPMFMEYMEDRYGSSEYAYKEHYADMDFNDRWYLEGDSKPGQIEKPACWDEMVEIAKTLSHDFPYVRVDLYVENDKPVFGELTFTPYYVQTEKSQTELGELLDISNNNRYKHLLEE